MNDHLQKMLTASHELPQLKPHHLIQEVGLTVDPAKDELVIYAYSRLVVTVKPHVIITLRSRLL